ncbi:MAG: hypothetical protein Q9183_007119, partial [Haloplaca sp. 2 TL-2023]
MISTRTAQRQQLSSLAAAPAFDMSPPSETQDSAMNCDCDPQIPADLGIDYSRPLANTVAPYDQHIVISTGKGDWTSRIEDENEGHNLARTLKDMTRRGGQWHDVR